MNTQTGKVALITGAAGGLAQTFVHHLVKLGYALVLTDRAPCAALAAELRGSGATVFDLPCDLAHADEVQGLAARALKETGRVDVLVNNAAYIAIRPSPELDAATWRAVQAVNVDAPFLLAQAFAPGMIGRGWGRIVNFASSTVWGPPPGMAAYVTSKMGVIGLTRALASEFGAHGITVNAISPGLTRHPGSAAALPPQQFENVRVRQFIPRTETPDDLAGVLAFLVSDEAGFITGQVLNVDGGGFGF